MRRRVYSFLFVLILLGANWLPVYAQSSTIKFFDQTGHNVSGEFLKFYNANPNATLIYGYPITEQFTSKDGRVVQYFQRARFEFHPELPEGQRVQLTNLGRETYTPSSPLNINTMACRTYAQTGYSVCFAFLDFFDKYGGVAQFGYPISPFEYHDTIIVQYFEKARLEWQPWKMEGQRVVITDLGRIYFDKLKEDPNLLPPVKPLDNTTVPSVTSLQVRAFVWKAVTLASDSQLIYLIVRDQAMQPVANAKCTTTVHWPQGNTDANSVQTNSNGVGIVALSFSNQPYGSLISIDVSCTYNNLTSTTTTSFRIWY